MTTMHNIAIDFSKNPELKEVFSRKKIGDSCTLEIHLKVTDLDDAGAKGVIKEIVTEDYTPPVRPESEGGTDEDAGIEPGPEEPVMIVLGGSEGKKGKKEY